MPKYRPTTSSYHDASRRSIETLVMKSMANDVSYLGSSENRWLASVIRQLWTCWKSNDRSNVPSKASLTAQRWALTRPPQQFSEQRAVSRGDRQLGVLEGVRVLIIEDVVSQRLAIQQALSDLGASCVVVTDLDEALTYVRSDHFDLITLDMRLDLMDSEGQAGFLLLDQMRVYQERASVVVVSGLGWSARAVRDFFVRNKVADVFLKPVDLNEFRQRIQAIMAERGWND